MTGSRRPPRPADRRAPGRSSGRSSDRAAGRVSRPGRDARVRALHLVEEPTVASAAARPDRTPPATAANRRTDSRADRRAPRPEPVAAVGLPSASNRPARERARRGSESGPEPGPAPVPPRTRIRDALSSTGRSLGRTVRSIGPAGIRRRHLIIAIVVLTVFGALGYQVVAGPLRQWRDQRQEIDAAEQRLEEVREERRRIGEQIDDANRESEVRRSARELFEMVDPGDDLVVIVPEPIDDLGLPGTWPFTGVERELGAG